MKKCMRDRERASEREKEDEEISQKESNQWADCPRYMYGYCVPRQSLDICICLIWLCEQLSDRHKWLILPFYRSRWLKMSILSWWETYSTQNESPSLASIIRIKCLSNSWALRLVVTIDPFRMSKINWNFCLRKVWTTTKNDTHNRSMANLPSHCSPTKGKRRLNFSQAPRRIEISMSINTLYNFLNLKHDDTQEIEFVRSDFVKKIESIDLPLRRKIAFEFNASGTLFVFSSSILWLFLLPTRWKHKKETNWMPLNC